MLARMRTKLVTVPNLKQLIQPCPGFAKKGLADYKLDAAALCEFGCVYCSSNAGNYLRIHRKEFAELTEAQTGERTYPADDPTLMFIWEEVEKQLAAELASKPRTYGAGKTLVFSMLTDGFSPPLVGTGVTERVLSTILEATSFRIRVLTKNAVVGSDRWLRFLPRAPRPLRRRPLDRFVGRHLDGRNRAAHLVASRPPRSAPEPTTRRHRDVRHALPRVSGHARR